MFGDKRITGAKTTTLDEKNRIVLPKFTSAEKEDKIAILSKEEFISLYSSDYIEKLFFPNEVKTVEDFMLKSKIYDELSKYLVAELFVGVGNRILIPSILIEQYKIAKKVILSGAIDHLNIYPNEEIAKKHIFMK